MNICIFTGRAVKDPETTIIQNGEGIITILTFAIKRDFKDKKTGEYISDFFRAKAFYKTANYIDTYINKGDLFELTGSIVNANYEKEGEKIYKDEIIINRISKLSSKKQGDDNGLDKG